MNTPSAPSVAARAPPLWQLIQAVARLVAAVQAGQSLTRLLETVPPALRGGAQALGFAVLRRLGTAQAVRCGLAPRRPAPAVDALLCTALALLLPEDEPSYNAFTVVDQAVEAAKRQADTRRQAAFVNACLRRFRREADACLTAVANDPVARWNHPAWWIKRLQDDYPDDWAAILDADQRPAPMDLRVNLRRGTVAAYCELLARHQIAATPLGAAAVRLARPRPVRELPGHAQGLVSVQSAAAQRAAPLLLEGMPATPLRVLDACAAPGGKTAHLLEMAGPDAPLQVTALEIDATRSTRIGDTLQRLGLSAQVLVADAARPQDWWQAHCGGALFDAILLDAPCTASGIVRRHPDVRWLRRESDIAQLAGLQAQLLKALWPLLRPGGRLLYCTCSVFRAEGDAQVQTFLAHNTDAQLLPSPGHLIPGNADKGGTVPDNLSGDYDGFFYALLQKTPQ